MSGQDTELIQMFVQESREHLDRLEPDLLSLESNQSDSELVNRIFRAVHSIKGASGFFGLKTISRLSHVMESLMSRVREKTLTPNQAMVDALLAGTDKLRVMVDDVDHSLQVPIDAEVENLQTFLGEKPAAAKSSAAAAASAGAPQAAYRAQVDDSLLQHGIKRGHFFYKVRLYTHKDIKDKGKNPLDIVKKIESLGQFLDSYTDISGIRGLENALEPDLVCVFIFSTVLEPDLMQIALEVPPDQIEQVQPDQIKQLILGPAPEPPPSPAAPPPPKPASADVPTPAPSAPQPQPAAPKLEPAPVAPPPSVPPAIIEKEPPMSTTLQPVEPPAETALAKTGRKSDDTIRVSVALLDDLMNLAGEMVLGRNQLLRTAESAAKTITGMPALLQNISLVTSDLQEKVMRTRLQPVGSILGKFHRIIRDMAHQLGKEIDLKTSGEDVELDKSILEMLSDPLTHLIRNCADHAIETPAEREQAGKPRTGLVRLSASHVGGQVHIEVVDDGRGLNAEKIKRKALEKGLLKSDDAQRMNERQLFNLIFLPGFSTADKVSDVSGRGVGMDVVRTNIEKLGGSVELDSELNRGTRICLRLPLTLAIIPAMIVGVGSRRFAMPQVNLEEIVRLGSQHRIETIRGARVIRLRGKLLPLVSLAELLNLEPASASSGPSSVIGNPLSVNSGRSAGDASIQVSGGSAQEPATARPLAAGYALVLKVDNNRFGLIVEDLHDSEEIVVKPLSLYLKNCKCYSGATIMGDGKVAMILDAGGIAGIASLQFAELEDEEAARAETKRMDTGETQSLLIFRNSAAETFAINLVMVARIEKIRARDIEKVGTKEYLKYRKSTLRLIRLHDFMPIANPGPDPEFLHVIVPKLVKHPMGIVVTEVEDAIQSAVTLDEDNISGTGILGSAVINGKMTIFVNIYSLFEAADPEHYRAINAAQAALTGKRVLLAEDTAFFRTIVSQYLKEFGLKVDLAEDGLEAWDRLNQNDYDILLTDIEMPGMNGFELTQRARGSDKLKHIPIIALTALSAENYVQRGLEAGVDAYEVKLDKEKLRATLERFAGGRSTKLVAGGAHGTTSAAELVNLDSNQ